MKQLLPCRAVMVAFILQFLGGAGMAPGADAEGGSELLPNGIRLPAIWPPRQACPVIEFRSAAGPIVGEFPAQPETPPHLAAPPEVIPIDIGRQLFVDDFLIERTTLERRFHRPDFHPGNPVLKPDRPWESALAMPFSDGVWFDPRDGFFKMWYLAGHDAEGGTCYAVSKDGIRWEKPELDVEPGTNIVHKGKRDSASVWLDHGAKDPGERFKMALWNGGYRFLRSADGIHWTRVADAAKSGDRSTCFYNPFRQRWVFSIRASSTTRGRVRFYWETADFFGFNNAAWELGEPVPWVAADGADGKRDDLGIEPQLYNLDCIAYESVLLGLFSLWRGDYRDVRATTGDAAKLRELGRPKQNSVSVGYSRDGFHWHRPDRRPFIPVSESRGDWNWGNVQSTNGCLVVGDELFFYFSGRAGKGRAGVTSADDGGATGLAVLRRDGFASMDAGDAEGVLVTRPVIFSGSRLFVNASAAAGALRVEILDGCHQAIAPFTKENCIEIAEDRTLSPVRWKGAEDLSALRGKPVRFAFHLRSGALFAFWVSPDASGASHGYVAGGGPGFAGPTDTVGAAALSDGAPSRGTR